MKWKDRILLWRRRRGKKKKKNSWMEIPNRVDIPTNPKNTSYIYLHPFLFYSLYFYPTLRPNKVLIWSWRLCSSDTDMTEKKKVWCEYFWHPFMRLLIHSWLSVFMWFICEVFDFAYIIPLTYIVESVTPHFRVISFVEW